MKRATVLAATLVAAGALAGPALAQVNTLKPTAPIADTQGRRSAPEQVIAQAPPPAAPATSADERVDNVIRKFVGEDHFLPMFAQRFAVTDERVITATAMPDRSGILVTAKGAGTSDIRLFNDDGTSTIVRFRVAGVDTGADLNTLQNLLAEVPTVTAKRVGDNLVVSGRLVSQEDERKFNEIIARFDVLDMVTREYDMVAQRRNEELLRELLRDRNLDTISTKLIQTPDKRVVLYLGGVAYSEEARGQANQLATIYFDSVVDQIELQKEMIELNAVLVTVDVNKVDNRGVNLFNQLNSLNFQVGVVNDGGQFIPTGYIGGQRRVDLTNERLRYTWFGKPGDNGIPNGNLNATLRMEMTKDYVSYYAEPFLTVLNGETASFQDGATTFVALVGSESSGVSSVETGIQVEMTPTIRANGKIRVDVVLDYSIQSQSAPSFEGGGVAGQLGLKRAVTTTQVEVNSGETIVISGNNSNLFGESKDQAPILGEIPIINLFFKSKNRNGTNTRSYFFVTPRLAPTVYNEGEEPFSRQGPKAKDYYQLDAEYHKPSPGFWLGWEKDPPAPKNELDPYAEDLYYDKHGSTPPRATSKMSGGGEAVTIEPVE